MHFSGHTYDPLGSLTFLLIKNVIYMATNPPSNPDCATPTYSTACGFFFCSPKVALAPAHLQSVEGFVGGVNRVPKTK